MSYSICNSRYRQEAANLKQLFSRKRYVIRESLLGDIA